MIWKLKNYIKGKARVRYSPTAINLTVMTNRKFISTLPVQIPIPYDEKIKVFFTLLCGASKGLMKTFKAFIKPFEALQGSMKIKI